MSLPTTDQNVGIQREQKSTAATFHEILLDE